MTINTAIDAIKTLKSHALQRVAAQINHENRIHLRTRIKQG